MWPPSRWKFYFSIHGRIPSLCPIPISTTSLLPKGLVGLIFIVITLLEFLHSFYHPSVLSRTYSWTMLTSFNPLLATKFLLHPFLFLTLYPWKNLSLSPMEFSSKNFTDCVLRMQFNTSLCSLFPANFQLYSEAWPDSDKYFWWDSRYWCALSSGGT